MSGDPPVVVGIGEVLWDLLPTGKQLGGAPANFAYHAQQLGARASVISAVGRDALGLELIERLRACGLDTSAIAVDDAHETGAVDVKVDADGVPTYQIRKDAAWDFIPFTADNQALAGRARIVCYGSLAQRSAVSRETIRRLFFKPAAALRVFDINLRQHYYCRGVIDESLHWADVLKLNEQEVPVVGGLLAQPPETRMIVDALFEDFPMLRLIAVTRGGKGSSLYARPDKVSHHEGYMTKVLDTVGAGDAFTAALAVGLYRRHDLDRINADANRLAAYVCSQPGAMPPIPADLRPAR